MPVFPIGIDVIKLVCRDCHGRFDYPKTKSNNRPKFCGSCRRNRTASNKRRFDELRTADAPIFIPRDKRVFLDNIPDYSMTSTKVVDAAIRQCDDTPVKKERS